MRFGDCRELSPSILNKPTEITVDAARHCGGCSESESGGISISQFAAGKKMVGQLKAVGDSISVGEGNRKLAQQAKELCDNWHLPLANYWKELGAGCF